MNQNPKPSTAKPTPLSFPSATEAEETQRRWNEIYRRLDAVQQSMTRSAGPLSDSSTGSSSEPSVEQKKAILKARAKLMAQSPLALREELPELEIVEFRMAHETYGFESRFVREVYPLREYCQIPCTPAFVLGLINVRGQLLSVLDLKKFFGLASQELDNHNQAIILRYDPKAEALDEQGASARELMQRGGRNRATGNETMELGVLADALLDVRRVLRDSLQPALPTLTGLRNEFLLGITPEGVIVLDAEKLLSSHNIIVYEEVDT